MARSMFSLGMFSFLPAKIAVRKRGLEFGSPPPLREASYSPLGASRLSHLLQFLAGFFLIFDLDQAKRNRGLARMGVRRGYALFWLDGISGPGGALRLLCVSLPA